ESPSTGWAKWATACARGASSSTWAAGAAPTFTPVEMGLPDKEWAVSSASNDSGEKERTHVFCREHHRRKPVIAHGKGIYLWDTEGKRYIDASGGAVDVNVGHGVEEIADAIRQQATEVAYAHASMFTTRATEELSDRLAERLPLPDARLYYLS